MLLQENTFCTIKNFVPVCCQIINKDGGTNKLDSNTFIGNADKFVCALMPESPTKVVYYTPGIFPYHLFIDPFGSKR